MHLTPKGDATYLIGSTRSELCQQSMGCLMKGWVKQLSNYIHNSEALTWHVLGVGDSTANI